jgi:hypothetical protein
LKLKCDEPLSNVAFNFNLRRYITDMSGAFNGNATFNANISGRGLRSSTFQLNLSCFRLDNID